MKFFLRRIIFFFFPRIIESSLIHKITETRANISNNDSQRSEFVGKLIDSDNRDSDPIAIGDEQLNYHRFEFERFNSQQRITRTTPERERERDVPLSKSNRDVKKCELRSQKLDKKFLFISLEIISSVEIVKSSCSVYRDSRYRVIE